MNGMSTIERGSTHDLFDASIKRQIDSKTNRDQASLNANDGQTHFEMSQDEMAKQKAFESLIQMNLAQRQRDR